MYTIILINVDELWLKGKNRPVYVKTIRQHIRELLKKCHPHPSSCTSEEQRIVARSEEPFDESVIQALLRVPGIHSILPARRIETEFEALVSVVNEELNVMVQSGTLPDTFKVQTKRSYKGFPLTSMEVSQEIGARVLDAFPQLKVDVREPQLEIWIRVMENNIYVSSRKQLGVGGLPTGTSGHLVSLLSGGFDSPVASYLMSKRGCRLTFVFFYAYPFVGDEVKEKITRLAGVLGRFQRHSQLYVIPFGSIQELISNKCKPDYRTVFFRKAMLGCSNLLARKVKADALVTGDALGQVSSQTIGNIAALDRYSSRPVFRPLVGFNKIEIIQTAKKIGTHDISIIPHDDACSLFAPKHPVLRPDINYMEHFHQELNLEEPLKKCIEDAEVYDIRLTGEVRLREKSEPMNTESNTEIENNTEID